MNPEEDDDRRPVLIPNPLVMVVMYLSRWRKFWFQDHNAFFWLLLAIPVMISFHSIVHEGSHSLSAAVAKDGNFPRIVPFLMEYRGKFQNGFTPSDASEKERVTERDSCDESVAPITHDRLAGWIGLPQAVAFLTMFGLALFLVIANITNPVIGFIWRAWFIAAAGDFMFNTVKVLFGNCDDSKDWSLVMIRGDHGFTCFRIVTLLLWLLIISNVAWFWKTKWATEPLPDRGFWGYRWAAFTLGVLSSISLLFYLYYAIVPDNDIGYSSAPFLFGLFLQIAAWGFYWVYFILTIKWDKPQENSPAV